MGERDDRIETLKARQEEMQGRLGGLDVEYGDLTQASREGTTPEQLDERAEDIGALTSERTALESELGRTEGELGELEAGAREQDRQDASPQIDSAPSDADRGDAAPDLSSEESTDAQELTDTVTQSPTEDVTETPTPPREDWDKISAEQALHKGQMTELRDAGNDIVANMNFASTDTGKEMYRDETGVDMTKEAQRGLEQQAYSGGVEQLNNLFGAHEQQRQALYANNTAEHPKVREAQMENRAAMDNEMNGLRYEIVQKEVCALEARKAVEFRNEDAIDHYRDRMVRQGRDAGTIEARENDYREMLSKDAAKDMEKMTTALHRDHFSTVPDHIRILEPAPASQQPGMARAAEEPNAPDAPERAGRSKPESEVRTASEMKPESVSHSVKPSDEHPEWHKIEAENDLQQRQIDDMQLAKGKVISELKSMGEEMGKAPTFDQLKGFYATSTKGFQELDKKFTEHDAQAEALHQGNSVEDRELRTMQMQNRGVNEHATQLFRYEATREVAEAVAKKEVELSNADQLKQYEAKLVREGASPKATQASMDSLKGLQEEQREGNEYEQTNKIHTQHCPELATNPPELVRSGPGGGGVGGGGSAMAPQQSGPGAGGAGGGAPQQQGPAGPAM